MNKTIIGLVILIGLQAQAAKHCITIPGSKESMVIDALAKNNGWVIGTEESKLHNAKQAVISFINNEVKEYNFKMRENACREEARQESKTNIK